MFLIPTLTAVTGSAFTTICLFLHMISQKPMQVGSPNLTYKCSTMSLGNPFILGSEGQWLRSRVTKHCRRESLHSCECWLLLVCGLQLLLAVFQLITLLILSGDCLCYNACIVFATRSCSVFSKQRDAKTPFISAHQ